MTCVTLDCQGELECCQGNRGQESASGPTIVLCICGECLARIGILGMVQVKIIGVFIQYAESFGRDCSAYTSKLGLVNFVFEVDFQQQSHFNTDKLAQTCHLCIRITHSIACN